MNPIQPQQKLNYDPSTPLCTAKPKAAKENYGDVQDAGQANRNAARIIHGAAPGERNNLEVSAHRMWYPPGGN